MKRYGILILVFLITLCLLPETGLAQRGRSSSDPALTQGRISSIKWSDDGKTLAYVNQRKKYELNLKTMEITEAGEQSEEEAKAERDARFARFRRMRQSRDPRIVRPSRGHQYLVERSPDSVYYAICENYNVVLEEIRTGKKTPVTTSGTRKFRFGTADWVWGEELRVLHGMWWTPDSKKLIYYVFDERPVSDFYLTGNWTGVITTNLVEGYTKAGDPNAIANLEIYDLETGLRTPIDMGGWEYIFDMSFTPDGKEFLFHRTDRHHRHLQVVAMNIETLKMRVVVEEKQETWQDNHPTMRFLEDGKQFIWQTEKSGYYKYELRHLNGKLVKSLTDGDYPDTGIQNVDEKNGWMYYSTCSDPENPLDVHLHRTKLTKGKRRQKLTIKPLNHSNFNFSPDGKYFIAQYENVATPPSTAIYSTAGRLIKVLAQGPDMENTRSELFKFTAVDGETTVYGLLHKPKNLDKNKKYPVIVSVYGGPASRAVRNTFRLGHSYNDRGYLVVQIDNRGTSGRGKAFKNMVYGKLGDVDIQDQADGIKYLRQRSYIDGDRVGIVGHSYGGYMAAMGILKHPDVFSVAVDRAGPTWWRNYDSIYTERYMNIPQDNPEGYENGNAMNYVENLKGHLLIMHGMLDDNVHPNNAFQLIKALNAKNKFKYYETRFFPEGTHGFGGQDMQMDFFKRYLKPE